MYLFTILRFQQLFFPPTRLRFFFNTSLFPFHSACAWILFVCLFFSRSAVGESGGRRRGAQRGRQRGAERTPGPHQRLPVPGLTPPEPRPDESQRHQ